MEATFSEASFVDVAFDKKNKYRAKFAFECEITIADLPTIHRLLRNSGTLCFSAYVDPAPQTPKQQVAAGQMTLDEAAPADDGAPAPVYCKACRDRLADGPDDLCAPCRDNGASVPASFQCPLCGELRSAEEAKPCATCLPPAAGDVPDIYRDAFNGDEPADPSEEEPEPDEPTADGPANA